jgi:glutathione S-transferase
MSKSLPILYSFRRCPYAMRARLALYLAKIDHEHREVDLKNKPAEMLAISPKGTVPVLQLEDGTILEQSLDIMKWALGHPSLPTGGDDLISENDTQFKYALDRYKYPGRYDDEGEINYRDQAEVFLSKLEQTLSPYYKGEKESLVDMAIFPFVRQFVQVDPQWFANQKYPHIKYWLEQFMGKELFGQIMMSYAPWKPADNPTFILFS